MKPIAFLQQRDLEGSALLPLKKKKIIFGYAGSSLQLGLSLAAAIGDHSPAAVLGPLTAAASLAAEYRLLGRWA